jgi:hypothetical protein
MIGILDGIIPFDSPNSIIGNLDQSIIHFDGDFLLE